MLKRHYKLLLKNISTFLLCTLENIRIICRHTSESISRTIFCNCAFIAIKASVMPNLKKKRSIAERITTFYTFSTAYAKRFIYCIFIVWVFDIGPFNCTQWAKLVFCCCIECVWFRNKITSAKPAVSAHSEIMNTFYSRYLENAIISAPSTLHTFIGIKLPNKVICPCTINKQTSDPA